ncbi:TIGR04255 family protein [Streptomyces sp. NPDC002088]|uniref:TIGR04255 family protein n=1 Tax=Streptomyces sp. NPDC002088 TaxID=3154665 RepID=UPI003328B748
MSESLRFERPPVQEVTLAFMLQPMGRLQTLDLAPLRVEWRADYPQLQEVAPLSPWNPSDRDSVEFVRTGLSWPMGMCSFSTESGDRRIRFQQDRFLLSWSFGEGAQEYPGFQVLKSELLEKFTQFSKLVHEATDIYPSVKRVDVQYVNLLPGISAHDCMAGILNGWSSRSTFPFRKPDYSGFRVHYQESELDANVAVLIGVDSVVGESPSGDFVDSAAISLDAEAVVGEGYDYLATLESAHDVLTSAFLEVTSGEMRAKWGESS